MSTLVWLGWRKALHTIPAGAKEMPEVLNERFESVTPTSGRDGLRVVTLTDTQVGPVG